MSRRPRRDEAPTPEELLAAYAAGALEGDEAASVEEHMASQPEARAEMESLRDAIVELRRAQPAPAREPDWQAMRQSILAECDSPERNTAGRSRLGAAARALLSPRAAIASAVAVAAAAALVLATRAPSHTGSTPELAPDRLAAKAESSPTEAPRIELRADDLDDLDEPELETLLGELNLDTLREIGPEDSLLPDDMAAEWAGLPTATRDDDEDLYAAAFEPGVFAEPDYEDWLDGLAEADIEALIDFLDESKAG